MDTQNAIAEYSVTTAELAKLKQGLTGKVYEVATTAGMTQAKLDRRGLVTLRTDLEKKRKEIKQPALDRCKLIDTEAKRIEAELLLLEKPIDDQIKSQESIEEAKRAEKAAIAAAAQKVLDDKIIEIGKLPLRCIGQTSDEITIFISILEAKPIGDEFTGETRQRAEVAKTEAVTAIREMLIAVTKAEEIAAIAKAEAEVAAAYEEQKRIERESAEKLQREEMAAQQAALDEQRRLNNIEAARLKEIADIEAAKLAEERAAFDAERKAEADKQAEIARQAKEAQDAIDAENKRVQDESEAKQREEEREAAILAEQKRIEAEKARKAEEKKSKLLFAKCEHAETAFKNILDICNNHDLSGEEVRSKVAIIAEANS